jgi:hypothetical protein
MKANDDFGKLLYEWDDNYSKTSTDDKHALGEIWMRAQSLYNGSGYETHNAIIEKLEFALSDKNKGYRPTTEFAINWTNRMIEVMRKLAAIYHLAD